MMPTASRRDDPFTQVLDALWGLIEGDDMLASAFKPGNRIKRSGMPRARKPVRQDADLPLLDIVPMGTPDPEEARSSSGAQFDQLFEFRVHSGSLDETATWFPVKWQLLRAFTNLSPLEFGLSFVKELRIEIITEAPAVGDESGGRQGWVGIFTVRAVIVFDREIELLDLDGVID